MNSYLPARQDKGFSRFAFKKGIAALLISSVAVVLVQGPTTAPSNGGPSLIPNEPAGGLSIAAMQMDGTSFLEELKSSHPSTFRLDAKGKAQIILSSQSFYSCTTNGSQEVVTAKGVTKEKLLFQLNQRKISYNVAEGLGIWTITWNEQLFVPAL